MGAGRAGAKATIQHYRDAGHHEIPSRGPLAALTVPGAVAAWMLALEAAKANRGKLPLDVLLVSAIKHAREGYVVTRSQARLTAEKLPEMKDAVGFRQAFLIDGKVPEVGALSSSRPPLPPRSTNSHKPGLRISTAAMSAARSPPIWNASAAR